MARFHYSMQSILNIKLKLETQAKQNFLAARTVLSEEEERLQMLSDTKQEYQEEGRRLLSGPLNLQDIEENKMAVIRLDDYIVEQHKRVEKAQDNLERARLALTEVMLERKTHESLKEKAFQQFLEEEKRQESREVDELTSYKYGLSRKNGNREGVPAQI